jgi:MFS family permease
MGVRSKRAGISAGVMGLAMATYYLGFVAGIPVLAKVHERMTRRWLFVCCSVGMGLAAVGYGLVVQPTAWLVLRFMTGFGVAGCYLVVETWLNDIAHNDIRGKVMGAYVGVAAGGIAVGQLILSVVNPSSWVPFAIAGAISGVAWIPLFAVKVGGGERHHADGTMTLVQVARVVPSGVVGFVLVGVTQGCLLMMASVYAARAGLHASQVAIFVGAITAGAVVLQLPIGALADRISRRGVMVALCTVTSVLCVVMVKTPPGSVPAYLLAFALGGFSAPLYALGNAYTHDWLPPGQVLAASRALLSTYSIGAVFGPLLAAAAMTAFGTAGFFWALLIAHALLAVFMSYRMVVAPDRAFAPVAVD